MFLFDSVGRESRCLLRSRHVTENAATGRSARIAVKFLREDAEHLVEHRVVALVATSGFHHG